MTTTLLMAGTLETWFTHDGGDGQLQLHAQLYDRAGAKIGGEYLHAASDQTLTVKPLYNDGAVLGFHPTAGQSQITPLDGAGAVGATQTIASESFDLEASDLGGYVVSTLAPSGYSATGPFTPKVQLYDAWGSPLGDPVRTNGGLVAVGVGDDGLYRLDWTDRDVAHSYVIDPRQPPNIGPIYSANGYGIMDDVGPYVGGTYNVAVDDTTPTLRLYGFVSPGTIDIELGDLSYDGGGQRYAVSLEDIARGYKDIALGPFADGRVLGSAHFTTTNGLASTSALGFSVTIDTAPAPVPTVTNLIDDRGPQTGSVAAGASTDDTTPGVQIAFSGAYKPGDYIQLFVDGKPFLASQIINNGAAANGYLVINTAASTRALPPGEHVFTAELLKAAAPSAMSAPFTATVVATPGDPMVVFAGSNARIALVSEAALPNGSHRNAQPAEDSGVIQIYAENGVASFRIDGHAVIANGAFAPVSFTTSAGDRLEITGYDATRGALAYYFTLLTPKSSYDPLQINLPTQLIDTTGRSISPNLQVVVGDDAPVAQDDYDSVALGAAATGNVITDASAGDGGDDDDGADAMGADGGGVYTVRHVTRAGASDSSFDSAGQLSVTGDYGVLALAADGGYAYTPNANAPTGARDVFTYGVRDADGSTASAVLSIAISQGAPPPDSDPGSGGQVLTSSRYGDTLVGGAGADTLNAGQGPDTLTGNGGADAFVFDKLPWNAGHVTDFAVGSDHLDLSALFAASGYAGTDPVADGYLRFDGDGAGGARVLYDTDGPASGNTINFLITTLDHVSPTGLTAATVLGTRGGPPPDPGPGGQVLTSSRYGDTLVGGAGDDTLNAGQGPDTLTGNGGADHFVFDKLPWNAGHVTDFTAGVDKVDLSALITASGYTGADPIADGYLRLDSDGAGGTRVLYDTDGPASGNTIQFLITTLDHVAPSSLSAGDWILHG
ncbi:MAG: hypothetical protein JWP92_896 [Caulobacter sp.]|nr:hypothetical protein [Caulobacter sp.]